MTCQSSLHPGCRDRSKPVAKTGGRLAKRARLELESKTGKKVVTGENYLPPASAKKILR
jgi:hypothetical protein